MSNVCLKCINMYMLSPSEKLLSTLVYWYYNEKYTVRKNRYLRVNNKYVCMYLLARVIIATSNILKLDFQL